MNKNIRYIPLRYDMVFKGFFSKEDNKPLLIDMLKNYLDLDIACADDIELINTELTPDKMDDKLARLDLRVKTKSGDRIK